MSHMYKTAGSGPGSSGGVLGARGLEFMVSRKAVDSLGLIMSGGLNRDDQVIDPPRSIAVSFKQLIPPTAHLHSSWLTLTQ